MKRRNERTEPRGRSVLGRIVRRLAADRGAVSPLMALLLIPIIGLLGLATESAGWYFTQRSAQNAADTAALAAATNGCTTGSCGATYIQEARSAAAKYGFQNGANDTTVAAVFYPTACPVAGTPSCYKVTITKKMPIYMVRVVGFIGDTTLSGGGQGQTVTATAVASAKVNTGYCITALAHGMAASSNALTINGGPNFDLAGCDVFSNASEKCNGSGTFGIGTGNSVGPSGPGPCGASQSYDQTPIADPYSYLSNATNIPSPPPGCTSMTKTAPATLDLSSNLSVCGNLTINGNVTVTGASSDRVITIYNGNLVIAPGAKLTGPTGAGLTVVFSGTAGNNSPGFVTSSGGPGSSVLEFAAPTSASSSVWKGVALYQDARMTKKSSQTYNGNKPTFNISGLIYAPYTNLTISGAINKNGYACLAVVADQLTVSGTGCFFANASSGTCLDPTSECAQQGVTPPSGTGLQSRQALVQ